MYLHIGGDVCVKKSEIVGIFDIENTSVSRDTKEFLAKAGKKKVIYVGYDMPKSFILCKEKIYISPISAATLHKRNSRMFTID